MTQIGFGLNLGFQLPTPTGNINTGGFVGSTLDTGGFMTGMGDPLSAFMSAINVIEGPQYNDPYGLNFGNQQSNYGYQQPNYGYQQPNYGQQFNSPFSSGAQAQAYAGPNGAFASASAGGSSASAQSTPFGQQYGAQPNNQLQQNQMLGAQMEEMGKDLKDDGIINGSHRRQQQQQPMNPMQQMMQFMMQMMMMIMQMMMQMMGMNPQQAQQMFGNNAQGMQNGFNPGMQNMNNPSNFLYGNNPVSGNNGASASAYAGPNGAAATATAGNNGAYAPTSTSANPRINGPVAKPTQGRVTSNYGMRTHPISGGRKMHHGIDVAAPTGTPVNSMANGKVVFAGKRGGYGNMIIVDHGNGVTTRYAHLNSINVQPGQQVNAGQPMGGVGSTGNSTGPHLHFEVRENGQSVDPRKYVNF
jgi:murein DD-endopeptidase MepM/ murein hydrolase activator NlpD